jgi:sulfur carrier protein ThiS
MWVEVHFHAELTRMAPDGSGVLRLEIAEGTRVADVLERLALDRAERRLIIGVDGQTVTPEQVLAEGARIDLLTPMAGGSSAQRFINL